MSFRASGSRAVERILGVPVEVPFQTLYLAVRSA